MSMEEPKDRKYMSVGRPTNRNLLQGNFLRGPSGWTPDTVPQWVTGRNRSGSLPKSSQARRRDEWCRIFDQKDACVVPVLDHDTAHKHSHNASREVFHECSDGPPIPRPAPRLDRTPAEPDYKEPLVGEHSVEVLKEAGLSDGEIRALLQSGAIEAPCFDPNSKL
uniref:Putative alpha-methylacyl-coa racemase n=1 Tax=Ixodes ricinus TaxID=34613 RepID=A0A0K8R367_IXORI